VRWLSGHAATLDSVRAWIARELAACAGGEPLWDYAIRLRATGELVGNIEASRPGARGHRPWGRQPGLRDFPGLAPAGAGPPAVALVCDALADTEFQLADTEFQRAVIRTDPHNVASIGVALRVGFASTGPIGPESDRQLRFVAGCAKAARSGTDSSAAAERSAGATRRLTLVSR
jgi:RimJ/RimL family protein N-acetyltransferase